jgi:hypothetical protein
LTGISAANADGPNDIADTSTAKLTKRRMIQRPKTIQMQFSFLKWRSETNSARQFEGCCATATVCDFRFQPKTPLKVACLKTFGADVRAPTSFSALSAQTPTAVSV